jgi:phytoene dehydrogenase-like protein
MQLERHGLTMLESPVRVFAPLPDGRSLTLFRDVSESASQIEKFSKADALKYREFSDTLAKMSPLLQQLLAMTPPDIAKPGASDLWNLMGAGRNLRKLGKKDMMRLIRWGPTAVADLAAEFFETEVLRAAIAARGIFGAALGPWSAGSTTLPRFRGAGWARWRRRWRMPRGRPARTFAPAPMWRRLR